MNLWLRMILVALLGIGPIIGVDARGRHPRPPGDALSIPGQFDYYLLALSWSPEFCASPAGHNPDKREQCGHSLGFVVHGLWPQNEQGPYPHDCAASAAVPPNIAAPALTANPPMPPGDPGLLKHEWSKHGTCSGLDMADYFATIGKAAEKVRIPQRYQGPRGQITEDRDSVEAQFVAANPGLDSGMIEAIEDRSGNLSEVRICLDKQLRFRHCTTGHRAGQTTP